MAQEYGPAADPQRWALAAASGGLGTALLDALHSLARCGPDEEYQQTLEALRGYPAEEVTGVLRRGWETLPESAYPDRLDVVQLLTDLRLPAATEVFAAILATPIPPERSRTNEPRHSTVGAEIIIRTTAVAGLTRLAAQDDAGAVDLLIRQAADAHRSVQVASVVALRDLGEGAGVDVSILVPERDQDLLHMERDEILLPWEQRGEAS